MLPSTHLIVSLILAIILFPFFGLYSFVALIGGFLIDVDHIILYWIRFKNLNLTKTYKYFREIGINKDLEEYKKTIRIFHSIEFIILIIIASFYHKFFLILLISLIIHMIMDLIHEYPKFKILKPLSLIYHIKNAKKQDKE